MQPLLPKHEIRPRLTVVPDRDYGLWVMDEFGTEDTRWFMTAEARDYTKKILAIMPRITFREIEREPLLVVDKR